MLRIATVCFSIIIALSSTSCKNRKDGIYPVSGKVTYHGAPAAGAAIFFNRKGGDYAREHLVMGIVEGDGSFELVCGPLGKGAPPGDYDVAVEWREIVGQSGGNPRRGPDKLLGRYADLQHPLLHAVIEARANVLSPFDLND